MENSLKQIGVTGAEAERLNRLSSSERIRELRQGLESYTNEVLADKPVSTLYHYWIGPTGDFFTAPSHNNSFGNIYNIDNQFDPQERSGVPQKGFEEVRKHIVDNPPQSVVLWYSPPGPASFDTNKGNPYSNIHYDYGQLYIHYFDGEKVNAVAVKVSNPHTLSQWVPNLHQPQTQSQDEIKQSLLTPLVVDGSIDAFIEQTPQSDEVLYTDKKGVEHSLKSVVNDIHDTFAHKKRDQIIDFDKTLDSLSVHELTEQKVLTLYLGMIQQYQQVTGETILNLSGSCGGTTITSLNINQILLELSQTAHLPSFSELLNPINSKMRTLNHSDRYEDYECPHCHTSLQGELKGKPETWKECCPKCGGKIKCAH